MGSLRTSEEVSAASNRIPLLQEAAGEQRERKARAGACVARMRNWKVAQALTVWRDYLAYQKASFDLQNTLPGDSFDSNKCRNGSQKKK